MRILVATDGSDFGRDAVDFASRLPVPGRVDLILLSVIEETNLPMFYDSSPGALADLHRVLVEQARERLLRESEGLLRENWSVEIEIREGDPAEQIVCEASRLKADLIVLGSRGRSGFAGYLLGSVSHRVLRHASCSVLLTRPEKSEKEPHRPGSRVLLAFDGSGPAEAAVDFLAGMRFDADSWLVLTTVHTLVRTFRMDIMQGLDRLWEEEKERVRVQLEQSAKKLSNFGTVECSQIDGEDISESILKLAKDVRANLIVLGHKGRSGLDRFLLGSVSSKVAHHARCSVLVVKEKSRNRPHQQRARGSRDP